MIPARCLHLSLPCTKFNSKCSEGHGAEFAASISDTGLGVDHTLGGGRRHATREYIFGIWCCHVIISCRVAIQPSQRQKESFLPEVLPAACDKKMLGLQMIEVEDIKRGSFHFKISDGFCFVLP